MTATSGQAVGRMTATYFNAKSGVHWTAVEERE